MAVSSHVYTYLLGAQLGTSSGFRTLFTAPDGYQTIVRDIVVYNPTQAAARFWVFWTYQGLSYTLLQLEVPVADSLHLDMRQVVPATALCQVWSAATSWSCVVTGYRLTYGTAPPLVGVLPAALPGQA